jgi:hypothetical protein
MKYVASAQEVMCEQCVLPSQAYAEAGGVDTSAIAAGKDSALLVAASDFAS